MKTFLIWLFAASGAVALFIGLNYDQLKGRKQEAAPDPVASASPTPAPLPLELSADGKKAIASLLQKRWVRFDDDVHEVFLAPSIWYHMDYEGKQALTLLFARRLSEKEQSSTLQFIHVRNMMTGKPMADWPATWLSREVKIY